MRVLALTGLLLAACPLLAVADNTFIVTSNGSAGPGTLRDAIEQVQILSGTQTIRFELPANSTITLNADLPDLVNAQAYLIDATASPGLRIDGNGHRIFHFLGGSAGHPSTGQVIEIRGIEFRSGHAVSGGCIAIDTGGNLLVRDSAFEGCTASADGGALSITGSLNIMNTRFSNNRANSRGGAIFADGKNMTIESSRFSDNATRDTIDDGGTGCAPGGLAGAVYWSATTINAGVTIQRSQFIGNRTHCSATFPAAGHAGAVYLDGMHDHDLATVVVNESWFANNSALAASALYSARARLMLSNTSFHANSSQSGSALSVGSGRLWISHASFLGNSALSPSYAADLIVETGYTTIERVANTVFARTGAGPNCSPMMIDVQSGDAVFASSACYFYNPDNELLTSEFPGSDFGLVPAQILGRIPALHPAPGSALIDNGSNALCAPWDVRGLTRPIDGDGNGHATCDIGAVEYDPDIIFADGLDFAPG